MDGKGVYTLRSLPMGASGLLWSMFISMPSAMILLWAAQLLAIYLGYGLYRMEVLLYNLPGNVDGMSRIGLSLIHISEPTRLGMISYAVFCLKKKKK